MIDIVRNRVSIIHAYRNLWSSFQKATRGIPARFIPQELRIEYEYNSRNGLLRTRNVPTLQIMNWPLHLRRPGHVSKKQLDIYIEFNHSIKGEQTENGNVEHILTESRVKVTYLQHVDVPIYQNNMIDCDIVEVVHYDLAQKDYGHPIFHAQFANDPVDGTQINRRYTNTFSRLEQLRIATPPMDLRAVLFGLVADHIPYQLADLYQHHLWKSVEQTLPSMPCKCIREKINGRMKNIHWYPT